MKKLFYVSLVSVLFVACTKYESGPDYSLLSKKERLSNNWTVNEAIHISGENSSTFQSLYPNYQFNIGEDENYSLYYTVDTTNSYIEKGKWKFSDDKLRFTTMCETGAEVEYQILRLVKNELWVRFHANTDEWELHLFPKPQS